MKLLAALLAVVMGWVSIGQVQADGGRARRVALPAIHIEAVGKTCVAPVEEMRRNHMRMLTHQRDRTVHQGERKTRFALKDCIECHAGRETGSVLGKDGFCSSCHAYASVRLDCFECHSPQRQGSAASAQR